MATAQGIIRYGGVVQGKIYYTAYYKNNSGNGASGPGDGFRDSQWMRAVQLSENTGLYSCALSSDIFLGAGATVNNGDQVVILAWIKSTEEPAESPGHIYYNQRWQDGLQGDHLLGFKDGNGTASPTRYGEIDRFVTKTFTMTGQSWNATPGGVGGDVDGDIDLLLNAAPVASISSLSTSQGSPTVVTLEQSVSMANGSYDVTTNRLYTFNGQLLFEQCSAAHGDLLDGSTFYFFSGLTYGKDFGTITGGDTQGVNWVAYVGPDFESHAHAFPHIDLYKITLQVRDDNFDTPLVDSSEHYVRVRYASPSVAIGARQYTSWEDYITTPDWSVANPNTIRDVVRLQPSVTESDAAVGVLSSETLLTAAITLDGSAAFVIPQAGVVGSVGDFLIFVTRDGAEVTDVYRIVAIDGSSVTIDTGGATVSYATRDWFFTASEPAGGTRLSYNWEVRVSGGVWTTVGSSPVQSTQLITVGTFISIPGIGSDMLPGWWLHVIDGAARGYYQLSHIPTDDTIELAAALSAAIQVGDSYEITCRDHDLTWAQLENDALDFRLTGTYSDGWTHDRVYGPITNNGQVSNLPPQSIVVAVPESGSSTTYHFDGRRSYGTQTTWVQESTLASAQALTGSTYWMTDVNLNTAGLRDGHAWILFFDGNDQVVAVFPILDLDRETPNAQKALLDTLGVTQTFAIGTTFRTTNAYEIEPPTNLDNDIIAYEWRLRSAATAQAQPTSSTEFETRFDREDGSGTGEQWDYTYSDVDDGRFACIELTVTDAEGSTHTMWEMFSVVVDEGGTAGRPWRIEWEG